jgi:hypothetical protein
MKFRFRATPRTLRRIEDGRFDTVDILVLIWTTVRRLRDRAAVILWSSFVLLMLWGLHGDMAVLRAVFGEEWIRRASFGLPWGDQLISFVVGFLLIVAVPCGIGRFALGLRPRDLGLARPSRKDRRKAWVAFSSLFLGACFLMFFASFDSGIAGTYPLFVRRAADGTVLWTITRPWEFAAFEAVYLLFFITIEFAFRGYLLFGLYSIRLEEGKGRRADEPPALRFGLTAVLIQMLAYTTWHYGKPVPEMVGTLVWGICAAAIALRLRSIWPVILSHWLYNVFLDGLLWKGIPGKILAWLR